MLMTMQGENELQIVYSGRCRNGKLPFGMMAYAEPTGCLRHAREAFLGMLALVKELRSDVSCAAQDSSDGLENGLFTPQMVAAMPTPGPTTLSCTKAQARSTGSSPAHQGVVWTALRGIRKIKA